MNSGPSPKVSLPPLRRGVSRKGTHGSKESPVNWAKVSFLTLFKSPLILPFVSGGDHVKAFLLCRWGPEILPGEFIQPNRGVTYESHPPNVLRDRLAVYYRTSNRIAGTADHLGTNSPGRSRNEEISAGFKCLCSDPLRFWRVLFQRRPRTCS